MKIGERIGAISRDDDGTIRLLGFGVFAGSPPTVRVPEPLLILDNGKTVLGSECLWEPEEVIRGYIKKLPVVYVETSS